MKKLDRLKPFAQVFGASDPTAFVQDGVYFDGSGAEIESAASIAKAAADEKAAAAKEAAKDPKVEAMELILLASVAKAIEMLPPMSVADLTALRLMEEADKNRSSMMAAIDAEIAAKDELNKQLG